MSMDVCDGFNLEVTNITSQSLRQLRSVGTANTIIQIFTVYGYTVPFRSCGVVNDTVHSIEGSW